MASYTLSPKAQVDIEEIWDYTAKSWSIDQAEIYVQELRKNIELIASQPMSGHSCEEVRHGYHSYPSGKHLLFYRVVDQVVEVVRILHGSMDLERHL